MLDLHVESARCDQRGQPVGSRCALALHKRGVVGGAEADDARAVGEVVMDESVGGGVKRGAAGDAMDATGEMDEKDAMGATSATVDDLDGGRNRGSSSPYLLLQLREFRAP